MNTHTYYTAVGHFQRRTNGQGQSYPVIIINQQEYCVDIQEMALWTALNWRLLDFQQVKAEYDKRWTRTAPSPPVGRWRTAWAVSAPGVW